MADGPAAIRRETGYAYTRIDRDVAYCPECGRPTLVTDEITLIGHDPTETTEVGAVTACSSCHPDNVMFTSHGPRAERLRAFRAGMVV